MAFVACSTDLVQGHHHHHEQPEDDQTVAIWITSTVLVSFIVAGMFASLLDAGVTTIIVCWGESPAVMAAEHPGVHEDFVRVTGRSTPIVANGYAYA